MTKDYSTISPSAQSLLWMKSLTDIPFARAAAAQVFGEAALPTEGDERITPAFLRRLLHFEARYWSIDAALDMLDITNILEVSSGFSFRGLQKVLYEDFFYIDTDLPGVVEVKEGLLKPLQRTLSDPPVGQLRTKMLNALDEDAFNDLVARFPPGKVAIANEGLLVYLDEGEKRRLCNIIKSILQRRGGCWVTADVYVRKEEIDVGPISPEISKFMADHHIEENKFDSFGAAESFFESCGLRKVAKVAPDSAKLRSMYLLKEKGAPLVARPRIRETWVLEAAG
jgi:O-methyltransferase involved in polyketide biosynthesis